MTTERNIETSPSSLEEKDQLDRSTKKKPKEKLHIQILVWRIQYEGIRMICYHCGKVGHKDGDCQKEETGIDFNDQEHPHLEHNSMNIRSEARQEAIEVKNPTRKRNPRPEKNQMEAGKNPNSNARRQQEAQIEHDGNQKSGGSRFDILQDMNLEQDGAKNLECSQIML